MRFYEPTSGTILLDGRRIDELDINWLRNNVTVVQQQSILFNESIFKNIALGQRDQSAVSKDQIEVCIDLAALQSTVQTLPEGLNTQVGNNGNSLSGGQRQRVAVARARLRDTPILILDESTSALDYISRKAVMKGILRWRRGKTTIVITHDPEQIGSEDFVYVLESGRIIEEGYRRTLKWMAQQEYKTDVDKKGQPLAGFMLSGSTERALVKESRRWSGVDLATRQRIRRPDSIELHLNTIAESAAHSQPPYATTANESRRPSTARPGSFVGNALRNLSDRTAPPSRRNSLLTPPVLGGDSTGTQTSIAAASRMHQVLSHGGRPMSMHQAITLKGMYEYSSPLTQLPRKPSASPHLYGEYAASTSSFSTVSERRASSKSREGLDHSNGTTPIRLILLTVWPSLSPFQRIQLLLGFFCALIHAASPPAFSYVFSELLATFFVRENQAHKAMVYSLAILSIAILDALADGGMHYLMERCARAWVDTLRLRAYERVLDQPKTWFEDPANEVANLTTGLDRNAEEMRNLVARFAPFVVVVVAMMCIAITWSMIVCWKVTLIGIAAAPSLYLVTKGFEMTSSRMERLTNEAGNAASAIFIETFSDIRTVRALTIESYFHKKFNQATSTALMVGLRRAAFCGVFFGASDTTINFVTALVFWYGARVAREGSFSVKSILTVFAMLLFSAANAIDVIAYIPQISASTDTASRLLRLSRLPMHQSHEHRGSIRLDVSHLPSPSIPLIQFHNFTFSYASRGSSSPALHSIDISIRAGTSTALVGSSGSGKSTIASLLMGMYALDTSEGNSMSSNAIGSSLKISGHSLSSLHIPSLRNYISIVSQTPTLFPTSIRANISYGLSLNSPLSTTANIHTAAMQAGIHDFILSLPSGYDTVIGDGGLGVSGGQAQRIAIARALVRKPRILILDEATSALDAAAVRVIRQTVVNLIHQNNNNNNTTTAAAAAAAATTTNTNTLITVLIITHAKEMMVCADNVIVLDQGRVVEQGTFVDLLASSKPPGALAALLGN